MSSNQLRESLQETITQLTNAVDYWCEQNIIEAQYGDAKIVKYTTNRLYHIFLAEKLKEIKDFIIAEERKQDAEKLRLSSRSDGGHNKRNDAWMEDSGVEFFGSFRD